MPESTREPRCALLPRTFHLVLALLVATSLAGVGCKKKPTPSTPAQPVEDAQPRDTRPTDTGTEVEDQEFEPQEFDDEGVDSGELSRADQLRQLQDQLRTVYFGYDQSDLNETTRRVLDANAKVLSLSPQFSVVVQGHCDERGTIEYNLALGQRRAEAVREYLVTLGVEARRLRTVSFGEERPVDPGSGESAWSRNRRAEFVVE
jgi:peptidoglycan-associated lipoprotein